MGSTKWSLFGYIEMLALKATFTGTGTSLLIRIREAQKVKIMLELVKDATDILPCIMVLHDGRVPYVMNQAPESQRVLHLSSQPPPFWAS